jgi:putative sigma-54 modulation protein
MELQVAGKNVEVTQQVKDYLNKKMKKLIRYLPNMDEAKVEIQEEQTKSPNHRVVVQITLRNKGDLLRAEERSSNVNTAIDAVTEVLSRRIERYKGKFDKKARGALMARKFSPTVAETMVEEKLEIIPEVVRTKRFFVKSMDIAEAGEQMELLSHDFFLFLNSESGELNLIYRRKDGNYGLIEPVLA